MNAVVPTPRAFIDQLQGSRIREVVRACSSLPDIIPLWFGEGDLPTPAFIRDAAKRALDAGDTYYTPNLGITPLREAIAAYQSALLDIDVTRENVCVTGSGMNAINMIAQALIDPGDEAVCITPAWPNLGVAMGLMGARLTRCPLEVVDGRWQLDLARVKAALESAPKLLILNSPSNPTGWMATDEEVAEIVALAAAQGTWIIADEVYARIIYDETRKAAPSALSHLSSYSRIVSINSFSKAWTMTGWRLGWITANERLIARLEKLMEFSVSCVSPFLQSAAVTAINDGEELIAQSVARYASARKQLIDASVRWPRVTIIDPQAAFYAMLRVEGLEDDLAGALKIAEDQRVGLAPGSAFGPESAGQFRLCYAVGEDTMARAIDRLDTIFAA